jgi:hypothetical protein
MIPAARSAPTHRPCPRFRSVNPGLWVGALSAQKPAPVRWGSRTKRSLTSTQSRPARWDARSNQGGIESLARWGSLEHVALASAQPTKLPTASRRAGALWSPCSARASHCQLSGSWGSLRGCPARAGAILAIKQNRTARPVVSGRSTTKTAQSCNPFLSPISISPHYLQKEKTPSCHYFALKPLANPTSSASSSTATPPLAFAAIHASPTTEPSTASSKLL